MLKGTLILLIVALAVPIGTPLTGQQVESVQTLPLVESPPAFGTFYLRQNHVPYPFDPSFGLHPVYQLRPGIFLVDDSQLNANPLSARDGMAVSPTLTIIDFLPPPCDSCTTNSDAGGPLNWGGNYDHPSNVLWLQIAGIISNAANLFIHTPSNAASDLFFTSALTTNGSALNSTNWARLGRAAPGETNVVVPELWPTEGYFQLGTMDDADNDGLTDAYEQFVSHSSLTNPNSSQAIYENVLSNQNPSGWFKLERRLVDQLDLRPGLADERWWRLRE